MICFFEFVFGDSRDLGGIVLISKDEGTDQEDPTRYWQAWKKALGKNSKDYCLVDMRKLYYEENMRN